MVERGKQKVSKPKGIRWGELEREIAEAAEADDRDFSKEVRHLVKLGLKRRKAGARP